MWAKLSMLTMRGEVGADADDQVEGGELNDGAAQALSSDQGMGSLWLESRTMRMPAMPKTAPEAPAPTRRRGVAEDDVEGQREQVAGDAGEHVDGDQAEGAEERLAEQAEVPEAPHVGGDVDEADVDEGGGEQTPPLAAAG